MLITALNDVEPYKTQVKVLLTSCKLSNPDLLVQVNCYGFNGDFYKKYNPNTKVVNRELEKHNEKTDRIFMSCVRRDLVSYASWNGNKVAWIDTDVIIRFNLAPFWKLVEPDSIAITTRPNRKDEFKVASGFFGVQESPLVNKFLLEYLIGMQKSIRGWGKDQLELYRAIKRTGIKVNHIPSGYHDLQFGDRSLIWHSRKRNLNNPKWVKEFNKYLEIANSL